MSSRRRDHRVPSSSRLSDVALERELARRIVELVRPVLHLMPAELAWLLDCEFGITRAAVPQQVMARRLGVSLLDYQQLLLVAAQCAATLYEEHVPDLPAAA